MRSIFAFLCFFPVLTFAANGQYFIGLSPISKGLGGTGVGHYTGGADALIKNSALLSELPGENGKTGFELIGTVGKQNLSASNNNLAFSGTSGGSQDSSAGSEFIPTLTGTYKVNETMGLGLSAMIYGGAKSDFSHTAAATGLSKIKADSSIGRLAVGFAYKPIKQLSFGISPFLKYGELALNTNGSTRLPHGTTGFGVQMGVAAFPMAGLTIGASIQPKVRLKYPAVADLQTLKIPASGDGVLEDLDSQEPMQIGFGASYKLMPNWKVTADYRFIGWSSADLFRELGWMDQHVIALGTEYKIGPLALRTGFNYAKSPVRDISGEVGNTPVIISGVAIPQLAVSNINLVAFPGVTQSHFCLGTGYEVSSTLSVDASFAYAPKVTITRAGTFPAGGTNSYSFTSTASQWAITLGASYRL